MSSGPNFNLTSDQFTAVSRIVDRYAALIRCTDSTARVRRLDLHMDLAACHNTNPLDLEALAIAADADFRHDVFGIQAHLNRETGILENCFVPRYSAKAAR